MCVFGRLGTILSVYGGSEMDQRSIVKDSGKDMLSLSGTLASR